MGNCGAAPLNVKPRIATWPSNSSPRYPSKRTENGHPLKDLHMNIHSGHYS